MHTQIILKHGFFAALLLLIFTLLSYAVLGTSPANYAIGEIVGYTSIVLSMIFVFLGIREYRNKSNENISFSRAVLTGLLIALFPAILFGIYNVVYAEVIDPEFTDKYFNHQLAQMKDTMSAKAFKEAKAEMESQKNLFSKPWFQFIVMFFTVWLIGIIVSILSAFVLNRKK
ncbi:MAG: DUF4199 domain-containing protein [Fulvivirga sp.]|nr:DUF4199 domain-containing protein [Fulvivirga sp.]